MRALRRFTVRAKLPEPLAPLGELVMNLRWSWNPPTVDLFASVDPKLWEQVRQDPVRLLGEVSGQRLESLAADGDFLARLNDAHADLQRYLNEPRWYQERAREGADSGNPLPTSIAYFSPEFGITEVLPQYSGGLGILAGDHLKAASDLGAPIVGVGLLYRSGYFSQSLTADGWQAEHYPPLDPHGLPLQRLADADRLPLRVSVNLPEHRVLHAHVWKAQVGRVPLLLLDSDIEDNGPAERHVTDRLYGGGADHRLLQEILLGVGGVRALRAYAALTGEPAPEVFHTNEGHAGFLGVERIRELVQSSGLTFDQALHAVRAGTVFTTHTPVPAGIDRFSRDLIAHVFGAGVLADAPGIPIDRLLALGAEDDPGVFNMAHMGLRLGQRANGVSKLHGIVSREMFNNLWSGFESNEVPITSVTNGVHAPTWVARETAELGTGRIDDDLWASIGQAPSKDIWSTRRTLRAKLVGEVRRRLRESSLRRGHTDAELGWIEQVFDPDVLTIGFARRVPSYKRLTLMLRDPDRLRSLLLDSDRPVQFVIAGKSHPADEGGKMLIQQMVRFTDDPAVRNRIVFLPDYDIGMARYLYWGCDVWLNNPLRPLEACGTSGMKASLNGGLNLSIRDGWWDEMFDGENGWAIPTADGVIDPDRRDDLEAAAFYDLLSTHVRTLFYDRGDDGLPTRWLEMVRHTLSSLGPKLTAERMVAEYVERLYAPAARSSARVLANDFAGARELAEWRGRIADHWNGVKVAHVESSGIGDTPELGASVNIRAEVNLGGLSPDAVSVQACYGTVDLDDVLHDVHTVGMRALGNGGDTYRYEADIPLEQAGPFGYTVRVLPAHELLTDPVELGLVTTA
ncbi:alpha-glucan family phosphorylase [Cryptosporangium sp. NPDC048952]|uniref:alpha-glucan family phosphorylase n=1 Tax=Cryptosporangium sp. NPDC048952 TaxID=3363961 RepID=UPI0037218CBA